MVETIIKWGGVSKSAVSFCWWAPFIVHYVVLPIVSRAVVSNWSSKGPCGCRFSFQPSKNTPDPPVLAWLADWLADPYQMCSCLELPKSIPLVNLTSVCSCRECVANRKWPRSALAHCGVNRARLLCDPAAWFNKLHRADRTNRKLETQSGTA